MPTSPTVDPGELDRILREQHVDNIPDETQRILAARVCGCPVEQIAGRMNQSVPAVYRAIEEVQLAIFRPSRRVIANR
jgi:hypothetical protein